MPVDSQSLAEKKAHFLVEQELAKRLRRSTREQRPGLFRTLYGELFARVPHHSRVALRENADETRREVAARMRLLQPHLAGVQTFLEFAPGDCRLAWKVCEQVPRVIAVDISDQSGGAQAPRNFLLVVYDGYHLDLPDHCADLLFSYQFIEHLHPDDVLLHFQLAHRLLRPGGKYIFATPHRFSGPHDISRLFSDVPQGFHLKEWTYRELAAVVKAARFSRWHSYRLGRLRPSWAVNLVTLGAELALSPWPRRLRRKLSARLFTAVTMGVQK